MHSTSRKAPLKRTRPGSAEVRARSVIGNRGRKREGRRSAFVRLRRDKGRRGGARKTLRVALLIESSRTYGRGILRGIANYAHLRGHWSCFTEERELHSGIPAWLQNWKGHGIIARIEDRRMAKRLLRLGLPVVDVLGNAQFRSIPSFDTDAQGAARMAADFFLRAGFRHFAFCGYRDIPFSDRRAAAFADYLEKHGRKVRVFSTVPAGSFSLGIQAVEQRGLGREAAIAAWVRKQPR